MHKKIALALFAMTFVTGAASAYYGDDTVRYYDNCGKQTGSAQKTSYGTVNYYDNCGKCTGSAQPTSYGTVNYYDNCGKLVGSSK